VIAEIISVALLSYLDRVQTVAGFPCWRTKLPRFVIWSPSWLWHSMWPV